MTRRRLLAIVLNVVIVAASVFYLLAPTVYTFFSEAQLSYSRAPRWFATTAPARLTARFFDRYNATAPRAERFQRQLSCFLTDLGATRRAGCLHEIRPGEAVAGPAMLKIASGRYVAYFEFGDSEACPTGGEVRLQILTPGRFGRILADFSGRVSPGERIELPFQLKLMDAALSALEFRATGINECVLLRRAGWTQAVTAG
jgi:hypothetical protein